jgi:hypothetical protein
MKTLAVITIGLGGFLMVGGAAIGDTLLSAIGAVELGIGILRWERRR